MFKFSTKFFNKNFGDSPRYTAFTLAEILIVLGIVGVIAEMTIPTLMHNVEEQTTVIKLKESYSQFNQALLNLTEESNCVSDLMCTGVFDGTGNNNTDTQNIGDAITKYLKTSKNCRMSINEGCGSNVIITIDKSDKTLDTANDSSGGLYRFIAMDGTSYIIMSHANCATNWSNNITGHMKQVCAQIWIDVNGPQKGPSVLGKDVFKFFITNGKGALLYPVGGIDDGAYLWWKSSNGCSLANPKGSQCAGRIIENGWKIDY